MSLSFASRGPLRSSPLGLDDGLVIALYDAVTRDEVFEIVLEALAHRFDCSSSALIFVDPGRPGVEVVVSYGVSTAPEIRHRYLAGHAADDSAPAAMARLRLGEALSTDDVSSSGFQDGSRSIRDVYRPLGLEGVMGGPVIRQDGRCGVVVLHRGPERDAFDDGDIAAFESILPHIIKVAELRDAFLSAATRAYSAEAALDSTPAGVILFDAAGILSHANPAARAMLDRRDGLVLGHTGRVRAVSPEADRALQRGFAEGPASRTSLILQIPRLGDGRSAYVVRLTRRASGHRGSPFGDALSLSICEPDRRIGDLTVGLIAAFGLSKPAARLTAALLTGEHPADYALRIGLSPNTVKFHLKTAFEATGCHRQSDLVRIAGAVARDLALGDDVGETVGSCSETGSRCKRAVGCACGRGRVAAP